MRPSSTPSRRGPRSGELRVGPPVAWVLNLDAEDELVRGSVYRGPSLARRAELAEIGLRAGLVREGDVVLDAALGVRDDRRARGLPGAAFMPTPYARSRLALSGSVPPPAPPLAVLRRANERDLLLPKLEGACFVRTRDAALAVLAAPTPTGLWLCKRALGAAGRGHRRVQAGHVRAEDVAWLDAALRKTGGVQLSPWVERLGDYALHATLAVDGVLTEGAPTAQTIDVGDAWRGSRIATPGELAEAEHAALRGALAEAGRALANAGYFGPFGIDAFRYRDVAGGAVFCACCDVNARYTMGFAVGMGLAAPDQRGVAPT